MKTDLFIEFKGKQVDYKLLVDMVKETWKADGNLMKDLESLDLYYKPEESSCFYVINSTEKGHFEV